ncbi:MAG TPA: helix-turn-helix domain-containing protein [Gaiellaceae bacterium]
MTLDPHQSQSYVEAAERQFATVRERLIERRRELGMSMSSLARNIGVSPSMISQIERGQSLPSVETLFALAAALGATVDTFFAAGAADAPAPPAAEDEGHTGLSHGAQDAPSGEPAGGNRYLVRRAQRAAINVHGGVRWERLTPQSLQDVEFLELIYEPGAESNERLYRHPGFEMVVVLEGRFDIYVGFERYELGPGDSMAFASSIPHRYVNPLSQPSRAVTTILRDPAAQGDGRVAVDLLAVEPESAPLEHDPSGGVEKESQTGSPVTTSG